MQKGSETKTVTFKYDPFGRRIEKKVYGTVSSTSSPLTGEDSGGGESKTYTYFYDNEDIIVEYLTKTDDGRIKTTATRYMHGPGIDAPLAIEQKGEVYYYHSDGLGSITTITDARQKTVESYTYDSYGTFKRKGDRVKSRYAYTAREWDAELGLYYYRARYYDPKAGRFITRDPIGFKGGVNVYGYVGGNPARFTDPWGLSQKDVDKIISFAREIHNVLTQNGYRIDPGWKNNACLYGSYVGLCEHRYSGCKEQSKELLDELSIAIHDGSLQLDDKWSFTHEVRLFPFLHFWVTGVSDNASDPKLSLDVWDDEYQACKDFISETGFCVK